MKTKRNVFKKIGQLILLVLFTSLTSSCDTEIPPDDQTPPVFSFRITGDGFDHTFNQDSDFDNIRLLLGRSKTYDFVFTGIDSGGVEFIQWKIQRSEYIMINTEIPEPWRTRNVGSDQELRWIGNQNMPLTGAVLTGNFTGHEDRNYADFRFKVVDFGGSARRAPNSVEKVLRIHTGNYHQTRIERR